MALKMKNAPLFYVLGQIKFNPIVKMSDYVPAIQEQLRHSGYSDYQLETMRAFKITPPLESRPPEINAVEQQRWRFTNAKKTEGYLLSHDALIYHTTKYDKFESFLEKTLEGLELLNKIIKLDYIDRIGLRYINAIQPTDHHQIEAYVNPSLLGFYQSLQGAAIMQSLSETTISRENATIVARFVSMEQSLPVPPDIFPLQLNPEERFNKNMPGKKVAVLDFDHFIIERSAVDPMKIRNYLEKFHDGITEVFHHAITEHAKQEWAK